MQRRNFPHLLVVVFTFLAMSVVWVAPFNSSAGAVSSPTFGEFGFANSEHGADLTGCVYAGLGHNAEPHRGRPPRALRSHGGCRGRPDRVLGRPHGPLRPHSQPPQTWQRLARLSRAPPSTKTSGCSAPVSVCSPTHGSPDGAVLDRLRSQAERSPMERPCRVGSVPASARRSS
jgi:hypothetical protein